MVSQITMEEGLESNNSYVGDLTPGFRFAPTEEELLTFYLHNKLECKRQDLNLVMSRLIPDLDIFQFNPWDLPRARNFYDRNPEQWFFFVPRQESEARGGRPTRQTTTGYWKGTGSPGYVYSPNNRIIGVKRFMVFYIGRAPNGKKTDWKLHEYKAIIQGEASSSTTIAEHPTLRHEFSLCRLYLRQSKCLISFDRRPVGKDQAANLSNVQPADDSANLSNVKLAHDNDANATIKSLQVPSMVDPEANLLERLFSGENKGLSFQPGESASSAMGQADEPIWDWEELENCFYVEHYANKLLE